MPSVAPEIALPERYRLVGRIAGGGMASVWEAEDSMLGRKVAIKVLAAHFARDPAIARRFQREARAAASLSGHPHVVTIYDVGEYEGRAFIVMERLTGGSVADALRRRHGRVPRHQALRWLREAGEALDAAHHRGIVHRDIKPANLLLDGRQRIKIADFGIARLADEGTLTGTGQVFGTAAYLSPEQAMGRPATFASDRYSLAVVAYELLTGTRPFAAEHMAAQARQHIEDPPPPASERFPGELPPAVDAVLARGLDKDPERRWPTAVAFVEALEDALGETTPPETDPTRVLAPIAVPEEPPPPPALPQPRPARRGRRIPGLALAAFALFAAAVVAVVLASGGGGGGSGQAAHRQRTATTPASSGRGARPHRARKPAPAPAPAPTATVPTPTPTTTAPPTGDPVALNAKGFALINQGRPADAVAPLQRAVAVCGSSNALDPCGFALYNLGHALRLAGRPAEAIPYLERRLAFANQRGVVERELDAARREAGLAPRKGKGKHKGGDSGEGD